MRILVSISLATVIASCSGPMKDKVVNEVVGEIEDSGNTINFSYMDLSVKPGEDFYAYANGTWTKNNPVPSTETRWGSFNELQKNNNAALKAILEKSAASQNEKGSVDQLIGDYYYSFMDSNARDKAGIEPIKPFLDKIDKLNSNKDLATVIADFHNDGLGLLMGIGVEQDLKDNSRNVVYAGQGGLGLPSKSYYTKTDDESQKLREDYKQHIVDMLAFIGINDDNNGGIEDYSEKILEFETALADASMTRVELRNYFAQYNPTPLDEFDKACGDFDVKQYIQARSYGDIDTIIVSQPAFYSKIGAMLKDYPLDVWKLYLKFHVINGAANYLSSDIEKARFAFYGKTLGGQKEMKPKWKTAISDISRNALGEALGHAFVNENFTESSKEKVNEMVENLTIVFGERIDKLEWMTAETKAAAKTKLESFTRKLGYPDKWTDYSSLEISRTSYANNVLNCARFEIKENTEKLHKPIDKTKWGMAPHIVNAYYNPLWNEIVFPAGIMQPPFFNPKKEDAVNYARMGAVIGHELTHGFDDQGAQFTAEGEFKNWWSESDQMQFSARTQKLVDQFNNYEALPGLNINGQLTLGENIADFGGLTIAYYAYQKSLEGKPRVKIGGLTNEQRFFVAFAQIWKTNYTEDALKMQVNTNPHSPGKWRVLGPLSNMPEFFEAFDIKEGEAMRQSEEDIAVIW